MRVACLFLLLTIFGTLTFGEVVQRKPKATGSCQNVFPTAEFSDCFIDLTLAIDMSASMGNNANIATLASSILVDFLPRFGFYDTFIAGLAFGAQTIGSSIYYDNYADICEYIHSAEQQASALGLSKSNLSA